MPSLFPITGQTLKIFSRKLSLQYGLYCSPPLAQNSKRSKNLFSRETVSIEFDSRLEIKCRPEYYSMLLSVCYIGLESTKPKT